MEFDFRIWLRTEVAMGFRNWRRRPDRIVYMFYNFVLILLSGWTTGNLCVTAPSDF